MTPSFYIFTGINNTSFCHILSSRPSFTFTIAFDFFNSTLIAIQEYHQRQSTRNHHFHCAHGLC